MPQRLLGGFSARRQARNPRLQQTPRNGKGLAEEAAGARGAAGAGGEAASY